MDAALVRVLRSPSGRTVVVQPCSAHEPADVPALHDALDRAFASAARVVVLDLQSLQTVSTVAFTVILAAHRDLVRCGRDLLVINLVAPLLEALRHLDRAGELRLVPVEPNLTASWFEVGALSFQRAVQGPAWEDVLLTQGDG